MWPRNPLRYRAALTADIAKTYPQLGRVDVDFFTHEKPTGRYYEPSLELRAEKDLFGSTRRARWFNR